MNSAFSAHQLFVTVECKAVMVKPHGIHGVAEISNTICAAT